MTLDDVVAALRERFTPRDASQPVLEAKITAEEWNLLAALVYFRDFTRDLETYVADPALADRARRTMQREGRDLAAVPSPRP